MGFNELSINPVNHTPAVADELTKMVAQLLQAPESSWRYFTFRSREFAQDEEAKRDATAVWDSLLMMGEELGTVQEIQRLGVQVVAEVPSVLDESFVHFAVFDPGRRVIEVSQRAIAQVTELLMQPVLGNLLGPLDLRSLVLWHEYYHAFMHRQTTTQGSLWRRRFSLDRPGRHGSSKRLREEWGAIHFSKLASQIPYHPQLMQWLLTYSVNPARAKQVFHDILEMRVMR